MNILLDGYFDRNFGDDIMMRIVMDDLSNHNFFVNQKREELLLPFKDIKNFHILNEDTKIDSVLTVIGSGFIIRRKLDILYIFWEYICGVRPKIKMPQATIGCNVGPYFNNIAKKLIICKINKNKLITVRESKSLDFIKKYCKNINVYCYPDIAFALPDKWIPDVESEGCLGISAYRKLEANNYVFYKKMAVICDRYVETTNKKVLLFAFDLENENDIVSALTIRDLCKHKKDVEIILHNDNGDNVIKNLKRCNKLIAVRFHMAVMAIRLSIPLIPIIYSEKTDNMFDDLGYRGCRFYLKDFKVEKIIDALNEITVFSPNNQIYEDAKKHSIAFEKEMLL